MTTTFPALELAILRVTRIDSVEVGDKIRWTIEGDRIGLPVQSIQVCTFSEWMSSLCHRAKELEKPIAIGFRNYHHGERRLVTVDWADSK